MYKKINKQIQKTIEKNINFLLSFAMHLLLFAFIFNPIQQTKNKQVTKKENIISIDIIKIGKKTNIQMKTDINKSSFEKTTEKANTELIQKKENVATQKNTNTQLQTAEVATTNYKQIFDIQPTNQNNTDQEIQSNQENIKNKDCDKKIIKKTTMQNIQKIDNIIKNNNKSKIQIPKDRPQKPKLNKENELTSLLKNISDTKSSGETVNQGQKKIDGSKGISNKQFDKNQQTTIKITDLIQGRFAKCWNIPTSTNGIESTKVIIKIKISEDGKVTHIKIVDYNKYLNDKSFHAITDSAIRAIQECSPIKELNEYDYNVWSEVTLTFDPGAFL